ncbi:uncharacterized protein (TIGR02001 family) [Hoeflea marina]|uniref:Uncharacterized protein (TIGR02001 family) n=1 Tax=Hoeflea marina TaxID=274592 RepID=A0A317PUK0_9HYPH|nr:TorF family putative porin [Hoeflea marina]PWW04375.1 uncharacterized protein (TIGR02001 family) [Hoeflea marina]
MKSAILLCATALAVASLSSARAEDAPGADAVQSRIDLAFGLALTSNYISHGTTQTEDEPALQGYVETSYNVFYLGAWASNVSFDGVKDVEIDLYGGVRPTFGALSLDLGYARYIYTKDSAVSGEIYAKGTYAVTDTVTPGIELYYDPTNETNWSAAKIEVGGLPWETAFSGQVGSEFGSEELGYTKYAWDAGFSKTFMDDSVKFDLRYHDANDEDERFAATLSYDFSTPLTGSD